MRSPRWQVAAVHLPLFLSLSLLWMIGLGLALALWLVVRGQDRVDPTEVMDWLGAAGLGAFTMIQMAGLALLAFAMSLWVSPGTPAQVDLPSGGEDRRERLRRAFPFSAPRVWVVVSVLGGLTLWTFPSFIAQELLPLLPAYDSTTELLTRLLRTAPAGGRAMVILAIVVSAPLFEELIFRGYLWRVVEASFGSGAALVLTTILFAFFHLDPVQGVALLPIALFLGWLRWRSGSLVPPILTHLMNNGLGVLMVVLSSNGDEEELGIGLALAGLAATIGVAVVGHGLSRRWAGSAVP